MSLILRRYARTTGYARAWFYLAIALGFAGLAAWAIVQRDWLVAIFATTMIAVALVLVPLSRRLTEALAASQRDTSNGDRKQGQDG